MFKLFLNLPRQMAYAQQYDVKFKRRITEDNESIDS